MRLLYSPNSPYARVCRVLALEAGLAGVVSFEVVTLRDPSSALLAYNPSGKVPTLVLADGHVLADTRIICEHFDAVSGGGRFIEPGTAARVLEGIAIHCLDGIAVWVRELRRPENERSPGVLALERTRAGRCMDHFEANAGRDLAGDRVDLGRISLACTIGFTDAMLPSFEWRRGRDRLAAWFDRFNARPSMQQTLPKA